jgi:hypothetical protein
MAQYGVRALFRTVARTGNSLRQKLQFSKGQSGTVDSPGSACRRAETCGIDRSWTSQLENVVMLCPGNEYVNEPFDTVTFVNWARFWLAEVLNGVRELTVAP